MSERAEVERAISLYFEASNMNDASIALLADDMVLSGPMMPEPITGAAAVRQYLDEIAPFIVRIEPKTIIIEGESAAVIVEFEGLNNVIFEGVEVFQLSNGLICSAQIFFDTRPLFKGAS